MPSRSDSIGIPPLLVSCLMVTLATPERLPYLQRSVSAFCTQTYPSRELVIVANGGTQAAYTTIHNYIRSLARTDIRVVVVAETLTLGHYRNISLESAGGDIFCQWDDDDLYHPERIERQLSGLLDGGHDAAYLQDVIQYFPRSRELYWTNWRATEAGAHPGTLMAKRAIPIRYPTEGTTARLGEDLAVALFLKANRPVAYISDMPHLFVYVSHGGNSWDDGHHHMLATELSLSQGLLRRREAQLRAGLRPLDFGPGEVSVNGRNGLAFTI